MYKSIMKTALVVVAGAIMLLSSACGKKADENYKTVGPTGPTTPSGYYFTLSVHPATVQEGGTVSAFVKVTNATGGAITGAVPRFSGSMSSGTDGSATTADGISGMYLTVVGGAGTIAYINAVVEDKGLTVPVQILP